MGTGSPASQHWAVGVWSDDRGITHHAKGGPPKHELPIAASGHQQWDGFTAPPLVFATHSQSGWLGKQRAAMAPTCMGVLVFLCCFISARWDQTVRRTENVRSFAWLSAVLECPLKATFLLNRSGFIKEFQCFFVCLFFLHNSFFDKKF